MSEGESAASLPTRLRTRTRRLVETARERQILTSLVLVTLFAIFTGDFSLASYIAMYGLFAVAYNFCLGRTGLLTFGHAAFFGLGAYGYGLFVVHLGLGEVGAWAGILVGMATAALGGLVVGALALRLGGTYLALVTLAIAQAIWYVAFQLRGLTGGDDGLIGIQRPLVGIPGVFEFNLGRPSTFFFFALVVLGVSMVVIDRVRQSNFGRVLVAIRENENRAKFLGYDTYRYKLGAFTISAAFSGLAGVLYPIYLSIVTLKTLHWLLSGEVNFWVILGGLHTFAGPILGTAVYLALRDWSTALTENWRIPVGLVIVVIVLFAPEGLLVKIRNYLQTEDSE